MMKVRSTGWFTGMATLLATTCDKVPNTGTVPLVTFLVWVRFKESEWSVMTALWAAKFKIMEPLLTTDTVTLYVF